MEKVRWGVLGTADIARGQTIPGMQLAEHVELYAVAGRKAEKAAVRRRQVTAGRSRRLPGNRISESHDVS